MFFSGPSAAAWNFALTSSVVVSFDTLTVRSTRETVEVGTRTAIPLSFPLSSGITRETALAAPVDVGIMDIPAARARLMSGCGRSRSFWSLV